MQLTRNALRRRLINLTILHYGKGVYTPPQQYVRLAGRIKIATVLATLITVLNLDCQTLRVAFDSISDMTLHLLRQGLECNPRSLKLP